MSMVVDCDSDVMEPADLWWTYLEPRFRDRAIRIERRDGVEHLITGEQSVLSGALAGLGGAHHDRNQVFSGELSYEDGREPASYRPAVRNPPRPIAAPTIAGSGNSSKARRAASCTSR